MPSAITKKRRHDYFAGIDIGSTTAKVYITDQNNQSIFTDYRRHNADIEKTLIDILSNIHIKLGNLNFSLSVTGSAGMGISETCKIPFVQEVIASAEAVKQFYSETRMLIDVGGEDTKMIFFNDLMQPDIRMNGNCAGGTGAFIDQIAALLNLSVQELDRYAENHQRLYPIASRCGVFAKTDIQNLLSNHVPIEDISASIFHAVALQTLNTLSRGYDVKTKVLFCGGPLFFLKGLRSAFIDLLSIEQNDLILPERPELLSAIGAANIGSENDFNIGLEDLIQLIKTGKNRETLNNNQNLKAIFRDEDEFILWNKKKSDYKIERVGLEELDGKDAYIGIDAGSTTTKVVLIDNQGRIAFKYYASNLGKSIESVKLGLKALSDEMAERNSLPIIKRTAVTGYGEDLIRAAYSIDDGVVETLAHYQAAKSFDQDVSFILDIGGQDMKAIFLKDGIINNIDINEACSSGCGSFIETFAKSLNCEVSEFAHLGCSAEFPRDLGTRCTVFMNSKVKQCLREGSNIGDISAGLAYSVIKNCLNKVLKIHDYELLGDNIVVQGGTFRNNAVLRAFENLLGKEVIRPDICELMGAYGAALIAKDNAQKYDFPQTSFIGFERLQDAMTYEHKKMNCKGCENNCQITRLDFSNGERFFTGNRCEKIFTNRGEAVKKGENLYAEKYDLLFNRKMKPQKTPIARIGIPRVLNMYENFPFWCTLFVQAGLEVELSSPSTDELLEKGTGSIMSDNICFPAKLVHGHIIELIEKGVHRIFFPMVNYEEDEFENSTNTYNCPIVTGYPDLVRSAINPEKYGIKLDKPHIVFNDIELLKKSCYQYLKQFGVDKKTFSRSFKNALKAQIKFKETIREKGRDILINAEKNQRMVIMLAGRPYHLDPLVNHKIPEMIAQFGIDIITDDVIPANERQDLNDVCVLSQWQYSNRLYNAAKWVGAKKNIEFIQLNSFGCGPDAMTVDEVKDILRQYDKISTFLRIDEITSIGSVKLRVRSLIESLKISQDENKTGYQIRKTTPLFSDSDRKRTIIAPEFTPYHSFFLEAVFIKMGYNVKSLPSPDRESVDIGLKYTNNDICYPAIICIGDIIKALQSGEYDLQNTAAIISETGGPCRASNYASLVKKALISAGYDNIPVLTISVNKNIMNNQPGFKINPTQVILTGLSAIIFVDALSKMFYATVVREKNRGDAQAILDKYLLLARQNIGKYSIKKALTLLENACAEFNQIDTVETVIPKIGIVGEIYVKYNSFGNNNTAEWLIERGVEVVIPPLLTFFAQSYVNIEINDSLNIISQNSFKIKLYQFFERILNKKIDKVNKILSGLRHDTMPIHKVREISERAERILSLGNQYGEGWLIAGEILAMADEGINNIICMQPFACIANHIVAKGISNRLKEIYPELNILFIDFDSGSSEVNMHNRLEYIIKNANSTHLEKEKHNKYELDDIINKEPARFTSSR